MLARISHIMAFFGGVWGIVLSLTALINLNFDAFPFLTLLTLLNSVTLVTSRWRGTNPQRLIISWVGVGILLSLFCLPESFQHRHLSNPRGWVDTLRQPIGVFRLESPPHKKGTA